MTNPLIYLSIKYAKNPTCQCCEVHQESGRERVHTVNGRFADLTACKGKYVSEDHSALKTEKRKEEKEEWGDERGQAK
jgi:hypothetical protein